MPDPSDQLRNYVNTLDHGNTGPAPIADARFVAEGSGGAVETAAHQADIDALYANAYEISGDMHGSDPRLYLDPQTYEELIHVCDYLDSLATPAFPHGWPVADELERAVARRDHGAPTHKTEQAIKPTAVERRGLRLSGLRQGMRTSGLWSSNRGYAVGGLTKTLFFQEEHPVHGYQFGKLNVLGQAIAIGQDRLLYALRGDELRTGAVVAGGSRQIRSLGWGALPDPELLAQARARDIKGGYISWGHRKQQNLADCVLNSIPPRFLNPAYLPPRQPSVPLPPAAPDAFLRHYSVGKWKVGQDGRRHPS